MKNFQLGLVIFLAAINAITFILFWFDKWMARGRSWRVPEKLLWLLALLGGSVGALAGMFLVRHKTKKTSFQFILAIIILIQAVLFYLILKITDHGRSWGFLL